MLHLGRDSPRAGVTAAVVSVTNKSAEPIEDYELRVVVPKGCRAKLQVGYRRRRIKQSICIATF